MAVAALEQPTWLPESETFEELIKFNYPEQAVSGLRPPEKELVFAVSELSLDAEARQRAAKFIGSVAAGASVEMDTPVQNKPETLAVKPIESLYQAVKLAAKGDKVAYKMVETNVATDVIERTIKSGHVMQYDLMVDEAGTIQQHGQSMESVQANSLRFAADIWQMRGRVEAETRNAFRMKQLYDQGVLEDYYFVVISRAADNMSRSEMADAGFFTDTMSCSIQVTTAQRTRLVTESAFVAGTTTPGGARHDQAAIKGMTESLGIHVPAATATEMLDMPLLVHKSLMPGGAINLVERYDASVQKTASHTGDVFFGEQKPKQDYAAYRQKCAEREKEFKPKITAIIKDLLAESRTITSPTMASERLNTLSGKHMIMFAGENKSIDPRVFGVEAAARIEVARLHYDRGNYEMAQHALKDAVKLDGSSSCPSGRTKKPKYTDSGEKIENDEDEKPGTEESGDCDFVSKECPMCNKKDVKTTVKTRKGIKTISGDCGCSIRVKADS